MKPNKVKDAISDNSIKVYIFALDTLTRGHRPSLESQVEDNEQQTIDLSPFE
jgi:sulfur transfer complex TusBCD TusB component (DsrH family)